MTSNRGQFAVVGAGIIGLTTAFELIKRGYRAVIFERSLPGSGASLAANGAITPYSDQTISPVLRTLAEESLKLYPDHLSEIKELSRCPIDYDTDGVLQLILNVEEQTDLRNSFESMRESGWPVNWLSGSEALSFEPSINTKTLAAVHFTSETRVDVPQLVSAFAKCLRQMGCIFSIPQQVVSVSPTKFGAVEVGTVTGNATFDGVIIATGGNNMHPVKGIPDFMVERIRGEIIETIGPPGMINHCLYRGDAFITPRRDGRMLIGTNYIKHQDDMDISKNTISVEGGRKTLNAASAILPELDRCEIHRMWKGWRPTTQDSLPVIGRLGDENIVVALGFGGLGFTLAPAASKLAAQILCRDTDTIEIKELSPLRSSF